ncbi:GumC family protein, partial [Fontibacter flavus]
TQDPSNTAIVPSSLSINDQTLSELIASFNNLQRERERMLRTTQPNNPIVVSLNQQIASLRTNILENIRNIKNGLEISRNSLTETSDQFQSRASRVPVIERELLDISRQQAIKQEHYLLLTRKREEAALSLAATSVTNSKVIDPPRASSKPVKPKKILIYGLGIVLGLAFPIGLIFIRDLIEEKIEFRADIEALTSTKILGEISRSKQTPDGPVIAKNTRNLIAEQFRFIRSNLTAIAAKNNSKVIMVTSGISGEGKTFFSINLAASLGLIGKSVAVLELDLRRPAMLSAIGISQGQGISDYLANPKIKTTNIARQMPGLDNVTVFGAGKTTEDPSELMAGDRMKMLISELSAKYDFVIIDTAPVGLVSDAFMLADFAEITVFMVRYGHSSKPQIKTIEDIRTNKKFKLPLIVLNDAKMEITYGYGNKYASNYYQK